MKKLIHITCFFAFMLSVSSTVFAQKFGHINSGNLLEMLPETKAAQSELKAYTDQLQKLMDEKGAAFQAKVEDFQKLDPSTVAPKEYELKQNALIEEEQKLRKEAQENEMKVAKKREELLKPIFERADVAIKAVGKEQGYTFIFDSSVFNYILFAEDSTDIMNDVKQKLGL